MNEIPSTTNPDPDDKMLRNELLTYFLIVATFAIGFTLLMVWAGPQVGNVFSNLTITSI